MSLLAHQLPLHYSKTRAHPLMPTPVKFWLPPEGYGDKTYTPFITPSLYNTIAHPYHMVTISMCVAHLCHTIAVHTGFPLHWPVTHGLFAPTEGGLVCWCSYMSEFLHTWENFWWHKSSKMSANFLKSELQISFSDFRFLSLPLSGTDIQHFWHRYIVHMALIFSVLTSHSVWFLAQHLFIS